MLGEYVTCCFACNSSGIFALKLLSERISAMNNIKIRTITDADNSVIVEIIRINLKKFNLDIPGTAYFDSKLDCLSKYYSSVPEKELILLSRTVIIKFSVV